MKLSLVLLGALLQLTSARHQNIYNQPTVIAHEKGAFAKNAVGRVGVGNHPAQQREQVQQQQQQQAQQARQNNVAGTFQRAPFGGARAAGAGAAQPKPANPRSQFQPNFGATTPTKSSTIAAAADWPWSGKTVGVEATPQVLVATVMTTITKFAVLTSTVTNNIIELLTSTETETEVVTRHSTRTVQVVTTQTNRYTFTKSITETETSTTYSLVPYTITEVETQTRTIESTILTTFTIPASTIHKTLFSTLTMQAQTVTMTEYLQPLIETIATETIFQTSTITTASIETVYVEVPVEVQVPVKGEYVLYDEDPLLQLQAEQDQREVEEQQDAEGEVSEEVDGSAEQDDGLLSEYPSEPVQEQGDNNTDYDFEYEDLEYIPSQVDSDIPLEDYDEVEQSGANIDDYPVSQSEQQAEFEFVSHLPSGAEIIQAEEKPPAIEDKIVAAIQHSPFLATNKLTANQFKRVY